MLFNKNFDLLLIKGATVSSNKKKDWFSHEVGLVFMYGEVYKGTFKNSATFKMELSATISNNGKLQRASSDELTTNCLLKFAKHLSCQIPPNARFYRKKILDYTVVKVTWLSAHSNKSPEDIY